MLITFSLRNFWTWNQRNTNISRWTRGAIHVKDEIESKNLKKQRVGELLAIKANSGVDMQRQKRSGIFTLCPSSCLLYPGSTPLNVSDIFLLLWTRLTWTISCCVLHVWKTKSVWTQFSRHLILSGSSFFSLSPPLRYNWSLFSILI